VLPPSTSTLFAMCCSERCSSAAFMERVTVQPKSPSMGFSTIKFKMRGAPIRLRARTKRLNCLVCSCHCLAFSLCRFEAL